LINRLLNFAYGQERSIEGRRVWMVGMAKELESWMAKALRWQE